MSDNDLIISVEAPQLKKLISRELYNCLERFERDRVEDPDRLYTRMEVAEMFRLNYSSIRRMINMGRLRTTADGRYISRRAINEYLKRNCPGSAGEQPGSMPEAIVPLQTESCRPGVRGTEVKAGALLLSDPDLLLQKTGEKGIEKNSKKPSQIITKNETR